MSYKIFLQMATVVLGSSVWAANKDQPVKKFSIKTQATARPMEEALIEGQLQDRSEIITTAEDEKVLDSLIEVPKTFASALVKAKTISE